MLNGNEMDPSKDPQIRGMTRDQGIILANLTMIT